MAGTKAGGQKAAKTNKELYGDKFYSQIGAKGGKNGHSGGFAYNHALASLAGAKGGRTSKRGKGYNDDWKKIKHVAEKMYFEDEKSLAEIARFTGMSYGSLRSRFNKEFFGI